MRTKVIALVMIVACVAVAGCSAEPKASNPRGGIGSGAVDDTSSVAGSRLAPGLYDLANGSAEAIGVLQYRDLEGGMWVVTAGSDPSQEASVVAVIANPKAFEDTLKALEGKLVAARGSKLHGASIRMSGPELGITSIEQVREATGPAD